MVSSTGLEARMAMLGLHKY